MYKETLLDKIIKATIGRLEYYFVKRWLDKRFGKREYWGDYITNLQQRREMIIKEYKDALIWCSGAEDFQIDGKAREGWEKIVEPLLKT